MSTRTKRPARVVAEDVEFLLTHHPYMTVQQLADRLGYSDTSGVHAALRRAGRNDLLNTLNRNTRLVA